MAGVAVGTRGKLGDAGEVEREVAEGEAGGAGELGVLGIETALGDQVVCDGGLEGGEGALPEREGLRAVGGLEFGPEGALEQEPLERDLLFGECGRHLVGGLTGGLEVGVGGVLVVTDLHERGPGVDPAAEFIPVADDGALVGSGGGAAQPGAQRLILCDDGLEHRSDGLHFGELQLGHGATHCGRRGGAAR